MVNQEEIHRMAQSEDAKERKEALELLRIDLVNLTDKDQAWADIIRLAHDKDNDVQQCAVFALCSAFTHIAFKNRMWKDFTYLIHAENPTVRRVAAHAFGLVFYYIPDKEQAWEDLHLLTQDKDSGVRWGVAETLGFAYPYILDKEQAWKDITRLAQDENAYVRSAAVESVGVAFPYVSDKKLAWEVLHWLTRDVRRGAAIAIGTAFPYILNKKQAYDDLKLLAQDRDKYVRISANYSLGRICIFRATEAESKKDIRKELRNALEFFEKSSKEATYFLNPARFCLPFYRSFYTLAFKRQNIEIEEVQRYIEEAKLASDGALCKENLLEAVENLANALKEIEKVSAIDLKTMKCDLNAYRRYCERTAELLENTEQIAPRATKLVKKGLPIIDQKIKEALGEIEQRARKFCEDSTETPFEKISRNAYKHIKGLGKTENPIKAEISLNGLAPLLRSMCRILPEESKNVICSQLDEIEEAELSEKARIIGGALSSIQPQIINLQEKLAEREKWIEYFKEMVIQRLDNINYGVFQLKLRSGEIVPALRDIQHELNKLKTIKTDLDNIGLNLTELGNLQHFDLLKLNVELTKLATEIETKVIPKLPITSDTPRILEKIQNLKQSKEEIWFNRVAGLSSIIGLILTIL